MMNNEVCVVSKTAALSKLNAFLVMVALHTCCCVCAGEAPKGSAEEQRKTHAAETPTQVQNIFTLDSIESLCEWPF